MQPQNYMLTLLQKIERGLLQILDFGILFNHESFREISQKLNSKI